MVSRDRNVAISGGRRRELAQGYWYRDVKFETNGYLGKVEKTLKGAMELQRNMNDDA